MYSDCMRLLLTSTGFSSKAIIDECVLLAQKPIADISVAIINEAYVMEPGGRRWL